MTSVLKKVALYALPCEEHSFHGPDEAQLQGLVGQMPGIVWTTDTDLRFTLSQGAALAQLGLKPEELVGQTLYEFFKTSDPTSSPIAAHHAALVGLAQNFEFSAGETLYYGCAEPLFDSDGNLLGTAAVVLDATRRRQDEQERLQTALRSQAARRGESLRVLARGVAHNFNNLLTAVIGYASLASRELPADSPVLAYIQGIEDCARQAAAFTGQLGTYCGNGIYHEEPIDLSVLIEGMEELIRGTLPGRVDLTRALAAGLPPIHGDAARLQQLVMSLLVNAAEAFDNEPGLIHVQTRAVRADQAFLTSTLGKADVPEGDYVWLQVSDSGCGMDARTRARIFEPFFSTKFLGRGLGMSTALGIVQAHHGVIAVSSRPKLGTTVHVLLPVVASGVLPLPGPHKAGPDFKETEHPADYPAVYYY